MNEEQFTEMNKGKKMKERQSSLDDVSMIRGSFGHNICFKEGVAEILLAYAGLVNIVSPFVL